MDPAHGGADTGARISDRLPEKDVTLAFAQRLRPLLAAAGFTVISTRDADLTETAPNLTTEQRAGIANHARALACILIHATPSGYGVHLYTSSLPADESAEPATTLPWDSAQSTYLTLSLRLANELGVTLLHADIPPTLSHASTRPIDNLTCPAVALELAPLEVPDAKPTPLSDNNYQQRTAQAITEALISWRSHEAPPSPTATPATKPATPKPTSPTAKPPAPKPAPAPAPAAPGAPR
nr:N-acetylmuramoyl-L-alanine amidase [Granulicella sp. dw_53]